MKDIYPSFYDCLPLPTEEGYIVFYCDECKNYFLPKINCFNSKETLCPYCGREKSLDYFYKIAYQNTIDFYYLESLKNLLFLIDIKIEDLKNISEEKMQDYLKQGYEKLNTFVKKNEIKIKTKVYIKVEDIVNINDYHEVKTKCCKKRIIVNKNTKFNYCIYCKNKP